MWTSYDSVCEMYVRYVTQKYGTATVIVFDGYKEEPTIKDATQQLRRTGVTPGMTVHFSGDMIIQSKKDHFLNNKENKQQFLVYLSDKLERAECITDHAKHDADVLIVQTAIASARTKDTVLVGDDIDLLVLLLHHADLNAVGAVSGSRTEESNKNKTDIGHKADEGVTWSQGV